MGRHEKLARDCWNLIKALSSADEGPPMALKDVADLEAAALTLIELACESAVEAERMRVSELHDSEVARWHDEN